MTCRLILGDSLKELPKLEPCGVDAVVTDPPAGIEFMGKEWDSPQEYAQGFTEAGTRKGLFLPSSGRQLTRNPMCRACRKQKRGKKGCVCANPDYDVENNAPAEARWRRSNRDHFIAFLTPIMAECLRVARPGAVALVWALPRTSHWTATALEDAGWLIQDRISHLHGQGMPKGNHLLKPACEDWWLCRKPGPKWLGVEECRIACTDKAAFPAGVMSKTETVYDGGAGLYGNNPRPADASPDGRWPANVVLSHRQECRPRGATPAIEAAATAAGDRLKPHPAGGWECHPECPVKLLDEQSGERKRGSGHVKVSAGMKSGGGTWAQEHGMHKAGAVNVGIRDFGDGGGPSRFFYVAKASKSDRSRTNHHPTVKSTPLMKWLVKLACPKGGVVLDPFMGSGSTGVACAYLDRSFIGIERDEGYFNVAMQRLERAAKSRKSKFFGV